MGIFPRILARHVLWIFLVTTMGCSNSNRAAIDGKVTLDGQPVDGGTISFIPTGDELGLPAWGEIKTGGYSIPAKTGAAAGANRVEIRWARKTGRMLPMRPPEPATEEIGEAVPARYNRQSELTANIKPGKNEVDFAIKSK